MEKNSILSKVKKTRSCWVWQGYISPQGYGKVYFMAKNCSAHRVVYELLVGKIPDGLQIDHLCRNRKCVNPKHLEPVTQKENKLRGVGWAGTNHRKTHCNNGHPLSVDNTYEKSLINDNSRICKTCTRRNVSKHKAKIEKMSPGKLKHYAQEYYLKHKKQKHEYYLKRKLRLQELDTLKENV